MIIFWYGHIVAELSCNLLVQVIKIFSVNLMCEFLLIKEKLFFYKDWYSVSLNPATSFTIERLVFDAVPCRSGMQLISTSASMVECVEFVTKAVLISHQCFGYC